VKPKIQGFSFLFPLSLSLSEKEKENFSARTFDNRIQDQSDYNVFSLFALKSKAKTPCCLCSVCGRRKIFWGYRNTKPEYFSARIFDNRFQDQSDYNVFSLFALKSAKTPCCLCSVCGRRIIFWGYRNVKPEYFSARIFDNRFQDQSDYNVFSLFALKSAKTPAASAAFAVVGKYSGAIEM
jgi:hypothetical protein